MEEEEVEEDLNVKEEAKETEYEGEAKEEEAGR